MIIKPLALLAGAQASETIHLQDGPHFTGILFPDAWGGGLVTFEGGLVRSSPIYPVVDITGAPIGIETVGQAIHTLDPILLLGVPYFRLVWPTPLPADTTVSLIIREYA